MSLTKLVLSIKEVFPYYRLIGSENRLK